MNDPTYFSSNIIQNQCFVSSFISKYSTKIGYVATKNILDTKCKTCIFICPGLTGFAIPFIEWFFYLHNSSTAIVAIDWRGFGLSSFDTNLNIYKGINIDTMTTDMFNLFKILKLYNKKTFLLGHSYGVLVGYNFLNTYSHKNISGFIQIEESLINMPQKYAADTTYPHIPTFSWNTVEKWINEYETFSSTKGYYLIKSALLKQFTVPGFASTENQLNEWMRYTNNINGNVLALAFKDAMAADYTYMVNTIFVKHQIPIFIYAGLGSIVPSETQIWIYDQVKNNHLSKLLLIKGNEGGDHTPFLPSSPAKKKFFKHIQKFINNIIFSTNKIHRGIKTSTKKHYKIKKRNKNMKTKKHI